MRAFSKNPMSIDFGGPERMLSSLTNIDLCTKSDLTLDLTFIAYRLRSLASSGFKLVFQNKNLLSEFHLFRVGFPVLTTLSIATAQPEDCEIEALDFACMPHSLTLFDANFVLPDAAAFDALRRLNRDYLLNCKNKGGIAPEDASAPLQLKSLGRALYNPQFAVRRDLFELLQCFPSLTTIDSMRKVSFASADDLPSELIALTTKKYSGDLQLLPRTLTSLEVDTLYCQKYETIASRILLDGGCAKDVEPFRKILPSLSWLRITASRLSCGNTLLLPVSLTSLAIRVASPSNLTALARLANEFRLLPNLCTLQLRGGPESAHSESRNVISVDLIPSTITRLSISGGFEFHENSALLGLKHHKKLTSLAILADIDLIDLLNQLPSQLLSLVSSYREPLNFNNPLTFLWFKQLPTNLKVLKLIQKTNANPGWVALELPHLGGRRWMQFLEKFPLDSASDMTDLEPIQHELMRMQGNVLMTMANTWSLKFWIFYYQKILFGSKTFTSSKLLWIARDIALSYLPKSLLEVEIASQDSFETGRPLLAKFFSNLSGALTLLATRSHYIWTHYRLPLLSLLTDENSIALGTAGRDVDSIFDDFEIVSSRLPPNIEEFSATDYKHIDWHARVTRKRKHRLQAETIKIQQDVLDREKSQSAKTGLFNAQPTKVIAYRLRKDPPLVAFGCNLISWLIFVSFYHTTLLAPKQHPIWFMWSMNHILGSTLKIGMEIYRKIKNRTPLFLESPLVLAGLTTCMLMSNYLAANASGAIPIQGGFKTFFEIAAAVGFLASEISIYRVQRYILNRP